MAANLHIHRNEIQGIQAALVASDLYQEFGQTPGTCSAIAADLLGQYARFFDLEPAALEIEISRDNLAQDLANRKDRDPRAYATPADQAQSLFGILVCAKGDAIAASLKAAQEGGK